MTEQSGAVFRQGADAPGSRRIKAFSLIELLLVVAIMGILCALAVPMVSPMLSGGALRMTAREFASAGRYARTMALLSQTPVDLVIAADGKSFSVEAAAGTASDTSLAILQPSAATNAIGSVVTENTGQSGLGGGFGLAVSKNDRKDAEFFQGTGETNSVEEFHDASGLKMSGRAAFSDSVNITRKPDGVLIKFAGYTDSVRTGSAWNPVSEDDETAVEGEVRIRYRANGCVRPYTAIVETDEGGDALYVIVNRVGSPKIRTPEDL